MKTHIPSPDKVQDPLEIISCLDVYEWLNVFIENMDSRLKKLVQMRFGLESPACTHAEVAKKLKISPTRVQHLQKKALRQLREWMQHVLDYEYKMDPRYAV